MRKLLYAACSLFLLSISVYAQKTEIGLSGLSWRSVGPATTSGRIADIAVDPLDVNTFYIAAASGGVWKTVNNATSWTPIFDDQGSFSIGCVAINPHNRHEVWVGTGENNNQRSVGYGDGLYKSSDDGKSWKKVGLENSEHIGMITFHPTNSEIVYVAAYGPLWNSGGDRGIYKTSDGGKTWERVLEVDENTGFNEVHYHPEVKGLLFATAHQRRRHVWTHLSGGPSSALYRSTDDGESWEKVSNGIPSDDKGRMSLAISPANPDRMYLMVEGHGTYISNDRGASWRKGSDHNTSGNYYVELIPHPTDQDIVYSMDTWAHFSIDGGESFKRMPEDLKHVDNHCIWINPNNPDHIRMGCDGGFYQTYDNCQTWLYSANLPITQFYRVSTDNAEPFYNIYGGTQDNFSLKGPSRTRSNHGIVNSDWSVTNTGDGFESQVDPLNSNIVYAQAQYGWLVRFDAATGEAVSIKPVEGKDDKPWRWNWDAPLLVSPHKPERLYFCANVVFRSEDRGQIWTRISEDLSRGEDRNTFPIMDEYWPSDAIAKHKSTSIYGNIVSFNESPRVEGLLYVGTDDGLIHVQKPEENKWKKYESFGDVPAKTYVQGIWPSQHEDDLVYAAFNNHKNGDFKPYLLVSRNKGKSWESITIGLPERGTVYAFAEDHVNPDLLFAGTEFGIFVSWNRGLSWKALKTGLPTVAVKDIEIQKRENDLVIATFGRGFYVLDNYAPLREMTGLEEKEGHLFEIKNGLLFEESTPLGYQGGGFQGAGFYRAENPEPGVVFSYYLKEVPETFKKLRKEEEKKKKKEKVAILDPTSEQMKKESLEVSPYVLLVIREKNGKEIFRKQTAASKGVSRIHWDGRYPSKHSINTGSRELYSASFVREGSYEAELSLVHDTVIKPIGSPRVFEIEHLGGHTLPTESPEELVAFQKAANEVRAQLTALDKERAALNKQIEHMHEAARILPGASPELIKRAQLLRHSMEDFSIKLNGDSRVAALEKETMPGLKSRLNSVIWNSWNSSSAPAAMQREQLDIVKGSMPILNQELQGISKEASSLYKDLLGAGMPALPNGSLD